jgi:TonB family protein
MVAAISLLSLPSFAAAGSGDLETDLNARYAGKVLTQRRFLSGQRLKYRSDGTVESAEKIGPWTVDAEIRVEHIALHDSLIEIKGRRLVLLRLGKAGTTFIDYLDQPETRKRLGEETWEELRAKYQVIVDIDLPGSDDGAVKAALAKVFLTDKEKLSDFVPDYWRDAVRTLVEGNTSVATPTAEAYRVGGGVSAPRLKKSPPPRYSEAARDLRYQGTVVLWVLLDETGAIKELKLQRVLGAGLDDQAVLTVRQWSFAPAMKDGKPVSVQINIEVNFHLY